MNSLSKRVFWTGLIVLTMIGACIRLYNLGAPDSRADEVYMLQPPASEYGPIQQFVAECGMFRNGRTMPIPRTTASAFRCLFNLKATQFTTRFPYAVMGILTIPALCLLGISMGDRRLGLILAFLGTISPFNIFFSRLAHVYAFPMLFVTLATAFLVGGIQSAASGQAISKRQVLFLWLSATLACYTHISTWPAMGLLWLVVLWAFYGKWRVGGAGRWRLLIAFGIWALCLSPWAALFIHSIFSADKAYYPPSYVSIATQFHMLLYLPLTMGWGGGFPRILASVGLPLCAIAGAVISRKWRGPVLLVIGLGLVVLALLGAGQYFGGADISTSRYYVPLWLAFMLLAGIGIVWLGDTFASLLRVKAVSIDVGLCAIVGIMTLKPIVWTITLPGNHVPYSKINRCLDENLPKGAPVLVDRWFEPWNEMLYHAPTNVYITFTIPDEPLDVFQNYQWRETAKDFFKKYPDAAYLELTKHYFHVPEVGYWDWPRGYFRHHKVISNDQAFALGKISLLPDPFFYWAGSNTNRIVVELFYNLPADSVEMAREAGQTVMFLYGQGWGYTKLWRQVRGDFRDWRVLEKEASLDIYNLTDSPQDVRVGIVAAAISGNKQVRSSSGSAFRFEQQKLMSWQFDLKGVAPGRQQLILRDPLWSVAKAPLLVGSVEVDVAQADSQAEAGNK